MTQKNLATQISQNLSLLNIAPIFWQHLGKLVSGKNIIHRDSI